MIENIIKIIKTNESKYDFNDYVLNYCDTEDLSAIRNGDDLRGFLESLNEDYELTSEDVIYYANAIEYLAENDTSLRDSLAIASELGYTPSDLSSEILASLLKSRNNEEDYASFIDRCVSDFEDFKDYIASR